MRLDKLIHTFDCIDDLKAAKFMPAALGPSSKVLVRRSLR